MLSSVNNQYSAQLQQHGINKNSATTAANVSFTDALAQKISGNASIDAVLAELKAKYGAQIHIETPPNPNDHNFQRQLNNLGSRTFGTNNVVIAPNMLEKMANDPKAKQDCMDQIQSYFDSIPSGTAYLASHGRQIVSSGVIVNEDGTVTSWCSADYTPEEKARLELQMKEEDKAKAERRAESKRLMEVAHEKSSQLAKCAEAWFNLQQSLESAGTNYY